MMIDDWRTYRLEDFIPFTSEIYFRLLERANETFWPLHLVTVALGLAALALAFRGKRRIALLALVPIWLNTAIVFHFNLYAEINVAAPWFGWAFLVQAGLLILIAASPGPRPQWLPPGAIRRTSGVALATFGVVAWPMIAMVRGAGWSQSGVVGLHPDPTAVATLGIILLAATGGRLALALALPMLWCLITTLTLVALDVEWAVLPITLALAAALTPLASRLFKRDRPRGP
jgi:hypothetical protein